MKANFKPIKPKITGTRSLVGCTLEAEPFTGQKWVSNGHWAARADYVALPPRAAVLLETAGAFTCNGKEDSEYRDTGPKMDAVLALPDTGLEPVEPAHWSLVEEGKPYAVPFLPCSGAGEPTMLIAEYAAQFAALFPFRAVDKPLSALYFFEYADTEAPPVAVAMPVRVEDLPDKVRPLARAVGILPEGETLETVETVEEPEGETTPAPVEEPAPEQAGTMAEPEPVEPAPPVPACALCSRPVADHGPGMTCPAPEGETVEPEPAPGFAPRPVLPPALAPLALPAPVAVAPEPQPEPARPLYIREYSDRAVIIEGPSKPFKERIRTAIPNARALWVDNAKGKGWLFSKRHRAALEETLADLLAPAPEAHRDQAA